MQSVSSGMLLGPPLLTEKRCGALGGLTFQVSKVSPPEPFCVAVSLQAIAELESGVVSEPSLISGKQLQASE